MRLLLDQGLPRSAIAELRAAGHADVHAILARSGAAQPSVRVEGLDGQRLARLVLQVLEEAAADLLAGAVATTDGSRVRLRHLPLR